MRLCVVGLFVCLHALFWLIIVNPGGRMLVETGGDWCCAWCEPGSDADSYYCMCVCLVHSALTMIAWNRTSGLVLRENRRHSPRERARQQDD